MGAARRRGAKSRYRRGRGGVKRGVKRAGRMDWKDGRQGTVEGAKPGERDAER